MPFRLRSLWKISLHTRKDICYEFEEIRSYCEFSKSQNKKKKKKKQQKKNTFAFKNHQLTGDSRALV